MNSSTGRSRFAKDYGQREQFTTRIKNLLKDYPDGLSIPKELIQNSDDAKATETALMLDLRTHDLNNLSNSPLKDFRGPALVFFNNRTFSEHDFSNLCKFGGETKLEDRKKVGKFGLGFNSVYNVTDLPQFVSGNRLCILDPHEKYLGRRGVAYNLDEVDQSDGVATKCSEDPEISELLAPFENLFGYDPGSVGNGKAFHGTIFRLPLRTALNASVSEIRSGAEYTEQDAIDLLRMTSHHGSLLLLFTQHVEKFEMKIMPREGGVPYSFEGSSWSREISRAPNNLGNSGLMCSQILQQEEETFNYVYEVTLRRPDGEQKWLISVVAPGPPKSDDGTLCVASVALCLSNSGPDVSSEKHLLFCFLPIPQPDDTRLPFMVNGTFNVTSSRRQVEIHTMDDKSDQADWNVRILREAVPKALVEALLTLKSRSQDIMPFFPNRNVIDWAHCVTEEFYKIITTDSRTTFFEAAVGSVSLADAEVYFLDLKAPKAIRDACYEFIQHECSNTKCMINIDDHVFHDLSHFAPELVSSRSIQLTECLPWILDALNVDNVVKVLPVIHYCLDHLVGNPEVSNLFRTSRWILTERPDGVLKKPEDVVHPQGKARMILGDFPQYLVDQVMDLEKENRLTFLATIGSRIDHLPVGAFAVMFRSLMETASDSTAKFTEIAEYLNTVPAYEVSEWKNILKVPEINSSGCLNWRTTDQFFDVSMKFLVGRTHLTIDLSSLGIPRNSHVAYVMAYYNEPTEQIVRENLRLMQADKNLPFEARVSATVDILMFMSTRAQHILDDACVPTTQGDFRRPDEVSVGSECLPLDHLLFVAHQKVQQNQHISEFLIRSGAQKSFSSEEYAGKLAKLEGSAVSDEQVDQIVSIMKFLRTNDYSGDDISIPDTHNIMTKVCNLCSGDTRDVPDSVQLKLCHQSISNDITAFLRIRTVKQAEQDFFDDTSYMDFGQEEQLSNRLRRIADGYSSEIDIFKEMLQNADDASATVCHFILDLNSSRSSSKVVNAGWEKLQEPALLVFNDAFFTQTDIRGLQRLGEGSKGNDITKIGQYGVGFNCVYKLTDTPSFLTQVDGSGSGILCVSDPLRKIVGNSHRAGACLTLLPDYIENRWRDTVKAFLPKEFQVLDGKTMFRLPLRKESGICESIIDPAEMKLRLEKFSRETHEVILFLRHIKTIRFSIIDDSGALTELGRVDKDISNLRLSNGSHMNHQELIHYASENNPPLYLKYNLILRTHGDSCRQWKVVEQFGSTKNKPPFVNRRENTRFSKLKAHAAVAFCADMDTHEPLVYSYLPVPHASAEMARLDINLPVVVNAQFCLDENRRFIRLRQSYDYSPEVQWNEFIAGEVIGECYAEMIGDEASSYAQHRSMVHNYLAYLPSCKGCENFQYSLALLICIGLFKCLKEREIPFVPIGDAGERVSKMKLPQHAVVYPRQSARNLVLVLASRLNFDVTRLEPQFYVFWGKCGSEIPRLNAQKLLDKLSVVVKTPMPIFESPFGDVETLVQFLEFSEAEIRNHSTPKGLPIFLTKDETLRRANCENHPICNDMYNLSVIFPQMKNMFVLAEVEQLVPKQCLCEPPCEIVRENMRAMQTDKDIPFEDRVSATVNILNFISTRSGVQPTLEDACVPTTQGDFRRPTDVSVGSRCLPLENVLFVAHRKVQQDQHVTDFLIRNGAQKTFDSKVYADKLADLEGSAVSDAQVDQIISILKFLRTKRYSRDDICIPNTQNIMTKLCSLCSGDTRDVPDSAILQLCHQSISNDITSFLRIRTVKQAEQDFFDDTSYMDFGQEEQLSNRLRRIADGYSSEIDVFKEMLQNADDASATVCHFILDLQSTRSTSNVVNNWHKLQDPALLVFNNAFFTQDDLHGLQKLGQGSKGWDVTKIGQYGVGFNCVYKLTDTPSFLTQLDGQESGILCVSDPLRKLVGKERRPGACLKLQPDYISSRWKDTIDAFFVDEFEVLNGKTMFRLPLRKQPGICSNMPASTHMKALLMKFCNEIPDLILFLRNINSICVSVVDDSGKKTELGGIKKDLIDFRNGSELSKEDLFRHASGNNPPLYLKYSIILRSHDHSSRHWNVVEQFGSTIERPLFKDKRDNPVFSKLKVHASVAFRTDTSLRKPLIYCYLPVPHASDELSRVNVGLPVAVNAQFCLDENRRFIQLGSGKEDLVEVQWNEFIAGEVVSECYSELVTDEASKFAQNKQLVDSYLRYLPSCDNPETPQNSLALLICKGLFKHLGKRNVPFVPVLDPEKRVSKMSVPENAFDYPPESRKSLIFQLAARLNLDVTCIDANFCDFWRTCGSKVSQLNAQQVLDTISAIIQTPTPISESQFCDSKVLIQLLEFSKSEIKRHSNPSDLPIFLTQDFILRRANDETQPVCSDKYSLSKVLPQRKDLFLVTNVEQLVPKQCIRDLEVLTFLQLIETHYSELFCKETRTDLVRYVDPKGIVNQDWVRLVWRYIASSEDENALTAHAHLSLIPVNEKPPNSWKLMPIMFAKCLIFNENQPIYFGNVRKQSSELDAFYHLLKMPHLEVKAETLLKSLVIGPKDTQEITFQLGLLHSISMRGSFHVFDRSDKMKLFDHLARNFETSGLNSEQVVMLSRLSIFETLDKRLVSISEQTGQCYSISDRIPRIGCLEVASSGGYTFFKDKNKDLLTRLGVVNQEDSQFYIEFLIPIQFARFSEPDLFRHLRYLELIFATKNDPMRDLIRTPEAPYLEVLSRALSETEFIHVNGEMKRPKDLYWPGEILFREFCDPNDVVPFHYTRFENLCKSLDFKKNVSQQLFHLFSLQLAAEMIGMSHGNQNTLSAKANLLLRYAVEKYSSLDRKTLTSFAALKMFHSTNRGVIALKGSILNEFSALASECKPILADHHTVIVRGKTQVLQRFGIQERPSCETVIDNLKRMGIKEDERNVEEQRSDSYLEAVVGCVKYVMKWGDLATVRKLQTTICIPGSGAYVLAPQQLSILFIFDPNSGIHHKYLSSISDKLDLSRDMLQKIGVTEQTDIDQIQRALLRLFEDLSADEQDPNLRNLALQLSSSFCERLLYENPSAPISIYLLNSGGTLTNAQHLFVDTDCDPVFTEQMNQEAILPLTSLAKEARLTRKSVYEIRNKLLALPEVMRVRNFSDHVKKSVSEISMTKTNVVSSNDLDIFIACLNSEVFSQCFSFLANTSSTEHETMEECTKRAEKMLSDLAILNIILVKELKIEIGVIPGKEIPGLTPGLKVEVRRKKWQEKNFLYVQCPSSDVQNTLIGLIDGSLTGDSKSDLKHLIFECADDAQREQWYEGHSCLSSGILRMNQPGDDVPFGIHYKLDRDPFQRLPLDDLVARLVEGFGELGEIFKFAIVKSVVGYPNSEIAFPGLYMVQTAPRKDLVEISGIYLCRFIQNDSIQETSFETETASEVEESVDRADRIVRAAVSNLPPEAAMMIRNRVIDHFMTKHNDDGDRSLLIDRIQNIQPPAVQNASYSGSTYDDQRPLSNYDVPAIPAVSAYIERRNRQMTREVEAYQKHVETYNTNISRWQNATPRPTPPPSIIQTVVAAPVGHPGKAQLQLTNARRDMSVCERILREEDSGPRTTHWLVLAALKAIESSLKCICLMRPTSITGFGSHNVAENIQKLIDEVPQDFNSDLRSKIKTNISSEILRNDKRLDDLQRQVSDETRELVVQLARRTIQAAEEVMD